MTQSSGEGRQRKRWQPGGRYRNRSKEGEQEKKKKKKKKAKKDQKSCSSLWGEKGRKLPNRNRIKKERAQSRSAALRFL